MTSTWCHEALAQGPKTCPHALPARRPGLANQTSTRRHEPRPPRTQAAIKEKLLKSAGANYDLGSNSNGYQTNVRGSVVAGAQAPQRSASLDRS